MPAEIDVGDFQTDEFGPADACRIQGHDYGPCKAFFIQAFGLFPVRGDIEGLFGGIICRTGEIAVDGLFPVELGKPFLCLGTGNGLGGV